MQTKLTNRGFSLIEFTDGNDNECTIQESSACRDEGLIWFGAKEVEVQYMAEGLGWQTINFEEEFGKTFIGNQRMHLTQSQVKELLPVLQYFAEHGELPKDAIQPI